MAKDVHVTSHLHIVPEPQHVRTLQVNVDGPRIEEVAAFTDLDASAPKVAHKRIRRISVRIEDPLGQLLYHFDSLPL